MLSGKSGFQRIVWAFKNVLNYSVTWLFCDLKGPNDGSGPISVHQPTAKQATYQLRDLRGAVVPLFPQRVQESQYEAATDTLEWLTLAMDQSARVQHGDDIDPYLSRYRIPNDVNESNDARGTTLQDLSIFQWRGLVHSGFIQSVFLATLKASRDGWFALSASAFDGRTYTFLQNDETTLSWEYQD